MLLIHQTGSVKVGEVVRYTVTYTPSQDRILPSPEKLHVRIRNTSAVALRAAFVHGPYTLSVAAYPSGFKPNDKFENPRRYGVPEFEPMVKAGGSWECALLVPEDIRQGAGTGSHGGFGKSPDHDAECASWVIEIASQVIFSTSAAVGYELLVARDHKSLSLGLQLPVVSNQSQVPQPGRLVDHQQSVGAKDGHHPAQPKGIFSRAIKLEIEDTAALWNTPRLPCWDDHGDERVSRRGKQDQPVESMANTDDPETKTGEPPPRKQKKVHLVILTHGLHSNLGADMLFMKESIDAAAKQAKIDRKQRKQKERVSKKQTGATTESEKQGQGEAPASTTTDNEKESMGNNETKDNINDIEEDDDEDDEEVIVRGYSGNATRTERGIKYLGKRLARYVLSITYPDQPYLPMGKEMNEMYHHVENKGDLHVAHRHSTIHSVKHKDHTHERPYKITSISFVAHSLGGLVQTYAVAYIQKHSPQFFNTIKPINFVTLATPFLGLSNENPVYVRFALDFGLVGRTGKDLGLTWRAPTIARSGWGAIMSNLGESAHKKVYGEPQPESKPLLRILPTGPAHTALKKFRNRTVYSNVVNDGIVPLRTSCLLFLDWHGLGRVEKARRDAGLVETMVGFGWAELTGANMGGSRQRQLSPGSGNQSPDRGDRTPKGPMLQVPQPADDAVDADERASIGSVATPYSEGGQSGEANASQGPLAGFFNLFKSNDPPKPQSVSPRQRRIYDMSQTRVPDEQSTARKSTSSSTDTEEQPRPPLVTTGSELGDDVRGMNAPPTTTFFESAGDLLNPHMPDTEYIVDPSSRPRTIFHDRVYHPNDIPMPPPRRKTSVLSRRKGFGRNNSGSVSFSSGSFSINKAGSDSGSSAHDHESNASSPVEPHDDPGGNSGMRVEEKIARGYHRDLSWRKVLVKLEPDAHNNIFVRRMFPNAYGWPVIKHLTDVHFSDSAIARSRTEDEYLGERALDINQPPDEHGGETKGVNSSNASGKKAQSRTAEVAAGGAEPRSSSEAREAEDRVTDLPPQQEDSEHPKRRSPPERTDSVTWSDRDWADSDNDSDVDSSAGQHHQDKQQQPGPRSEGEQPVKESGKEPGKEASKESGKEWNWAEKIVGKGASGKAQSSTQQDVEQAGKLDT